MENKKQITAVGYCRCANNGNETESSIDTQKQVIQEYADKRGLTIKCWYLDYGSGTSTTKRNDFQKMIADSKKQDFEQILVAKTSAFSRSMFDYFNYKKQLKESGVSLVSVTEQINSSPECVLTETIMETLCNLMADNEERIKQKMFNELSARIKRGKALAKAKREVSKPEAE